jgi:PPOX class probable F420-dependent enzyme
MRAGGLGRRLALVTLADAEIERLLDAWPVARLATVAPDGRPHLVPIVFVRHAGALWSPVDGKPKAGAALARLAHVAHEPRVCLLLDHYDADWRRLWWIRVDGRAEGRGGDAAVEAALRAKYPQYRETPLYVGVPTLLRIEPERVRSWAA